MVTKKHGLHPLLEKLPDGMTVAWQTLGKNA